MMKKTLTFILIYMYFIHRIECVLLRSAHTFATQRSKETPVKSHESLANQKTAYSSA